MITQDKINVIERDILMFIAPNVREILKKVDTSIMSGVEEVRLRASKPLMLGNCRGNWFINREGRISTFNNNSYIVEQEEIIKTLELMSENSIYAFLEEIRNGFITIKGGHRVGIAGRVVLEGSNIKNIKDISGLNIRISREIEGCSQGIVKYIIKQNSIQNTLIVSPPQCGKTTMLRDIARTLSDGVDYMNFKGIKVGVIDERSEIAACFKGVAQNKLGFRTDVYDACPKAIGMTMMVRSMSPDVIITDEIGSQGDKEAVMKIMNCGVKIIASAHGVNISELKSRREVLGLIEQKVFERFIVLSNKEGPGTLEEVIDGVSMDVLYRRDRACC